MPVDEQTAIDVLGAVPTGRRKAKVLPVVIVDQQEKLPLTRFFDPEKVRVEVAHLATGDYSLKGCTHLVAVERKGLADILACVTSDRDRFFDQMRRLRDYPSRFLIVEATKATIEAGAYERDVKPSSVTGTLMSLAVRYNIVPVYCKDQREAAERVQWILLKVAELKKDGFYKAYEESLGMVTEEQADGT